jgi:hypothetical protein
MAGNVQADSNGDILVEFDYNNIIVVDPNRTIDNFGNVKERLVDHESLVMYANLEVNVMPRTKLLLGSTPESGVQTISIARMNFLKPNGDNFLTAGYYDELTGNKSVAQNAQNQPKKIVNSDSEGRPYTKLTISDEDSVVDNGLLGITDIQITTNSSFVPSVKIELEDVFSIDYASSKKEEVIYKQDTLSQENYFSESDMRAMIAGSRDAITTYKTTGPFISSAIIGAASGILFPYLITPVIPALWVGLNSSKWIKIKRKNVTDKKYLKEDMYVVGYGRTARGKRVQSSLKGAGIGLASGILTQIIINSIKK